MLKKVLANWHLNHSMYTRQRIFKYYNIFLKSRTPHLDWNISLSKYNLNNCIVFQGNVLSWLALYASLKWCYSNRSRKSEYIKILKTYVLKISLGNKNTRNLSYTKLCIDKINALWLIQKVDQKHYMLCIIIYHGQIFISYKYICSPRNEYNIY